MIRKWLVALGLALLSLQAPAAPSAKLPQPLLAQVQRLTHLLSDGDTHWAPGVTLAQRLSPGEGEEDMALVAFTLQGRRTATDTQYLAAFRVIRSRAGESRFSLIDTIRIGDKGWRGLQTLKAELTQGPGAGEIRLSLDADAPTYSGRRTSILLSLKDGNFRELMTP